MTLSRQRVPTLIAVTLLAILALVGWAPQPVAARVAVRTDNCAYFNDTLSTVIAMDIGAGSLDPSNGRSLTQNPAGDLALLQQLAAGVRSTTPPAGLEAFHADLLAAIDSFLGVLAPAVPALNAGDTAQAHTIVDAATKAFEQATATLNDTYPDAKQQIDACTASGR